MRVGRHSYERPSSATSGSSTACPESNWAAEHRIGSGGGGGRHVGSCFRIQGKKLNHSGSTEAVWRVERNGGWLGVNTVRM